MQVERLPSVIKSPIISEKTTLLSDKLRQFTFKVDPAANKRQVKLAIELLFNVQVEDVRIVNVKGKTRAFGKVKGKRNDVKKAYIRIPADQDIDFITTA